MGKDNQRVAITKRLLKEALLRLLKTKDIKKIHITELCSEAGINRATFYRHYNVPNDVLLDIENDIIEKTQNFAPIPKTLTETKTYLVNLCTYLYENAELIRLLIRCNSDTDCVHILDNFYNNILKFAKTSEGAEKLDEGSIKLLSTYVAGGGYYMVRQWLMEDIPKTPAEIAELVFGFLDKEVIEKK